jgi:probable RNA-binding protein EIF1AD
MSGAGRKGNYRKGVTDEVLHGNPVPEEGELVARVVGSRGGNVIEVFCGDNTEGLAVMPQKFRKLVWVKRGDFVIVSGASTDIEVTNGSGAIRYRVKHILYKDQIRHIKNVGVWPEIFNEGIAPNLNIGSSGSGAADEQSNDKDKDSNLPPPPPPSSSSSKIVWDSNASSKPPKYEDGDEEEGSDSEEEDDDSDLFVNMNRRKVVVPSSEEEEEVEEDE